MYIYQLREIIFTSLKPRFPPRQGSMYTDTTTKNNEKCFQTIYNNLYQVLVLCSFIVDQNEHKYLMINENCWWKIFHLRSQEQHCSGFVEIGLAGER